MYATSETVEVEIWPFKVDNPPTYKKDRKLFTTITSNLLTLLVLIPNDKTMHKFFYLIYLYIALVSPAFLQAQESFTNRYNAIYITMNEGLPNNFVDDIYKDRQGFLWISMSDYPDMTATNSLTSP